MHPVEVSGREAAVLAAVGAHLSNAQIAGRLHLSVRTVEGHVSSLLRKYGMADRRELAALVGPDAGPAPPPGGVAGLPEALTSFVGRAAEQDAVLAALAQHRLVTLSGPGGVGKTRPAVVVAGLAAFPFGGAFVDLVPAREDSVPQAVAAALGVAEGPQQPLSAAIAGRLARGRSLLVLDNCEHVVNAVAAFVERLLAACPTVTVLATSRERLAVPGERVVALGPLPLGSDAERLFGERAVAPVDSGAVTDLCARLDGLPLAIELAAARSAALGAPGLLTGLGDYLRLLAGGRGAQVRHRSLRAVIGWSHDLLDDEERALFRRLAAFAGAFDLPSAAAVGGVEPPGGRRRPRQARRQEPRAPREGSVAAAHHDPGGGRGQAAGGGRDRRRAAPVPGVGGGSRRAGRRGRGPRAGRPARRHGLLPAGAPPGGAPARARSGGSPTPAASCTRRGGVSSRRRRLLVRRTSTPAGAATAGSTWSWSPPP